jgi:hypothetical protein
MCSGDSRTILPDPAGEGVRAKPGYRQKPAPNRSIKRGRETSSGRGAGMQRMVCRSGAAFHPQRWGRDELCAVTILLIEMAGKPQCAHSRSLLRLWL